MNWSNGGQGAEDRRAGNGDWVAWCVVGGGCCVMRGAWCVVGVACCVVRGA